MGSYTGQRLEKSGVLRWIRFALLGLIVSVFFQGALCDLEPTESQCRPYIEKALKEQHAEAEEQAFERAVINELNSEQEEFPPTDELTDSTEGLTTKDEGNNDDDDDAEDDEEIKRKNDDEGNDGENVNAGEKSADNEADEEEDIKAEQQDDDDERGNEDKKDESVEDGAAGTEEDEANDDKDGNEDDDQKEGDEETAEPLKNENELPAGETDSEADEKETEAADDADVEDDDLNLERRIEVEVHDIEMDNDDDDDDKDKEDEDDKEREQTRDDDQKSNEEGEQEKDNGPIEVDNAGDVNGEENAQDMKDDDDKDEREVPETEKEGEDHTGKEEVEDDENDQGEAEIKDTDEDEKEKLEKTDAKQLEAESEAEQTAEKEEAEEDKDEAPEEEELTKEMVIPENLRPRNHIDKILRLEDSDMETVLEKTIDATLKALKTLYDNAIKPLEILYKYRDLSNRHFGDPEIFSKPLILFMGPWSGGKSSTINYLLDNEFSQTSLRTGAEPSPAYFNILMHGEEEEVLDGTQLAADWTFSGLQKFGQSLLDRLKGIKMPNKLLEKVNIVEIPGILEIRKQVQRLFPFNDACQWFIDRADIIFLVYDPSKLDVGPETEAILDQLKGREYQTRIILNKADQVKPEELMRVQGTLIWNISPLMSSSEPPIMYSTSLWSLPYEVGAPTRLLQAQERAFLKDLREAIDKRVENKIASARRFAVRVRNHAKMVDCYLTTYYNHKTIFGNRKRISDDIIEYPQKYHIYEGLSTLTNISRYDLPDPDVYKDFFKINPLYEFKKLSETCTYFRGCPINKLDVAIAYDLPELVGKFKKSVETAKEQLQKENS